MLEILQLITLHDHHIVNAVDRNMSRDVHINLCEYQAADYAMGELRDTEAQKC
jgi:hypothetical protein